MSSAWSQPTLAALGTEGWSSRFNGTTAPIELSTTASSERVSSSLTTGDLERASASVCSFQPCV